MSSITGNIRRRAEEEDIKQIYARAKSFIVQAQNALTRLKQCKTDVEADSNSGAGAIYTADDVTDLDTYVADVLTKAGNIA